MLDTLSGPQRCGRVDELQSPDPETLNLAYDHGALFAWLAAASALWQVEAAQCMIDHL